jgi:hypothetical protein
MLCPPNCKTPLGFGFNFDRHPGGDETDLRVGRLGFGFKFDRHPGCTLAELGRPWALECNAFGINTSDLDYSPDAAPIFVSFHPGQETLTR